ncbi:hypothetical protein D3C87_1471840 [compost metagenome]
MVNQHQLVTFLTDDYQALLFSSLNSLLAELCFTLGVFQVEVNPHRFETTETMSQQAVEFRYRQQMVKHVGRLEICYTVVLDVKADSHDAVAQPTWVVVYSPFASINEDFAVIASESDTRRRNLADRDVTTLLA